MDPETDVEILDESDRSRYAAYVDGDLAGYAEYQSEPGRIVFTHTVVADRFEGRGVGSRLASSALEDARRKGLRVEPRCRFIAAYIERHQDYADLIDQVDRP